MSLIQLDFQRFSQVHQVRSGKPIFALCVEDGGAPSITTVGPEKGKIELDWVFAYTGSPALR